MPHSGPALEPQAKGQVQMAPEPFLAVPGDIGTNNIRMATSGVGLWLTRYQAWRNGFTQQIAPNCKRYWRAYRAFDDFPAYGPGQEWRDRTVLAEFYKIVESRLPAIILGQYGSPNWFATESRGAKDEMYEELWRVLMQSSFDGIGTRERHRGDFIQRMIDGHRYREIMGHVFWKMWWRTESKWLKFKEPQLGSNGHLTWKNTERLVPYYDNIDFDWLTLDRIAIDLSGARRWIIERHRTSIEVLNAQDEAFYRENGRHLYDPESMREMTAARMMTQAEARDTLQEPDDTEGWPLDQPTTLWDPRHTQVEMWLCWDNVDNTLTKIVNRTVILDEGSSPTPDGKDPYISSPSIAIPNRVYGESIGGFVLGLNNYQTKIVRARGDEIVLNVFRQFMAKEGTVLSNQFFFEPGGLLEIVDDGSNRDIRSAITTLERPPVFSEAWTEEQYRQTQAEAIAEADALSQGVEATQKSRDVSAREVQQRATASSARSQFRLTYEESSVKRQMLLMAYDLIRQNLTTARTLRVLDQDVSVDLRALEAPINIRVGGGLYEVNRVQRLQQVQQLLDLAQRPVFTAYMKPGNLLQEALRLGDFKQPQRFVRTDDEVAQAQAQAQGMAGGGGPGGPNLAGTLPGGGVGAPPGSPLGGSQPPTGAPAPLVEEIA